MRAPNCGESRCCMESRPPYPRGQALVDSSSLRYGEKASYYSAVCLETDEVEWMELDGNSNSGTSAAFPEQLREGHARPLTVIWDNALAHRGEAVREYLRTPGLKLRLVNRCFHEGRLCWVTVLTSTPMRRSGDGRERRGDREPVPGQQGRGAGVPSDTGFETAAGEPLFSRGQALLGYSLDFNPDETVWGWAREEGRQGTCTWAARTRCGRESANSWPGCPAGKTR